VYFPSVIEFAADGRSVGVGKPWNEPTRVLAAPSRREGIGFQRAGPGAARLDGAHHIHLGVARVPAVGLGATQERNRASPQPQVQDAGRRRQAPSVGPPSGGDGARRSSGLATLPLVDDGGVLAVDAS
jgi:hypothetical protein